MNEEKKTILPPPTEAPAALPASAFQKVVWVVFRSAVYVGVWMLARLVWNYLVAEMFGAHAVTYSQAAAVWLFAALAIGLLK